MITIAPRKLHAFVEAGGCTAPRPTYQNYIDSTVPLLTLTEWEALIALDLKGILAEQDMAANAALGGEEILQLVAAVLEISKTHSILSWCGPTAEVLILGYQPTELEINHEEEKH